MSDLDVQHGMLNGMAIRRIRHAGLPVFSYGELVHHHQSGIKGRCVGTKDDGLTMEVSPLGGGRPPFDLPTMELWSILNEKVY